MRPSAFAYSASTELDEPLTLLDGLPVGSCLAFAVAVDGRELTTIECPAADDGTLHPVQQAFQDHHGLECRFCTPGFVLSACGYLAGP